MFLVAFAKHPKASHIFLLTLQDIVFWLMGIQTPMCYWIRLVAGSQLYDQANPP
jgi:hypothetical protein